MFGEWWFRQPLANLSRNGCFGNIWQIVGERIVLYWQIVSGMMVLATVGKWLGNFTILESIFRILSQSIHSVIPFWSHTYFSLVNFPIFVSKNLILGQLPRLNYRTLIVHSSHTLQVYSFLLSSLPPINKLFLFRVNFTFFVVYFSIFESNNPLLV